MKSLALALIRFYQCTLSPMLPSTCRFYPTCSAYASKAIEEWGLWRGAGMAVHRLLRCRPWGGFGYDPVPEKPTSRAGDVDSGKEFAGMRRDDGCQCSPG